MTDREPANQNSDLNAGAPARPTPASDVSRRRVVWAGIIQTVAGVFLVGLMTTVAWRMAPMLLAAPEALADGSRFNASPAAARIVLALFGSVILFGVIAITLGMPQVSAGTRPPRGRLYVLWAAAALIVVMVVLVVLTLKQGAA